MKAHQHFYSFETSVGKFAFGPRLPKTAVLHGRFANRDEAQAYTRKLRRDYLSSALDLDGKELDPVTRTKLAIWHPNVFGEALLRGRAACGGPGGYPEVSDAPTAS